MDKFMCHGKKERKKEKDEEEENNNNNNTNKKRGSRGVGVTIESYGKVEISYINVDNF
jgi:hypothetical protein